MKHVCGKRIPVFLIFAVAKDCTVRSCTVLCREWDCAGRISGSKGRHGRSLRANGAAELKGLEEWLGKEKNVRDPWKQTRGFGFVGSHFQLVTKCTVSKGYKVV